MQLSRQQRLLFTKCFSLFSVIRGYNIIVIVLAQYITSIYLLAPSLGWKTILMDTTFLMLILASSLAISSGYIINNFYDKEKDKVNRPNKSKLDRLISQQTKLVAYFIGNMLAVFCASYVSFKAVVFFSSYIFGIWFYSHKLKKYPIIGNITSSLLAITPLFAVFVYYKNYQPIFLVPALLLLVLITAKELIKDLENLDGDLIFKYKTIAVVYGEKTSKYIIAVLLTMGIFLFFVALIMKDLGVLKCYCLLCILFLVFSFYLLYKAKTKESYVKLHTLLKIIIVLGIFSIPFIQNAHGF